jgi:hypothetical protein
VHVSADVYAAWLTAGDRLQPAGDWLAGNWHWLAPVAAAAMFAAWAIRRCLRDANETVADIHADFSDQPEPRQPGTDVGLYLDCVAIYSDCNDLDRLRDAIDQHRKEDTP